MAAAIAAQTQQPTFRAAAELVQIDVIVRDKNGASIRGLTKDDFVILENGKPRPVAIANEYHGGDFEKQTSMHSDVATNGGDRLVLFVLNDHTTGAVGGTPMTGPRLAQMKDAARTLIRGLAGRAQMGLLRISAEPGVEFTSDAQALLDALELPESWRPPTVGVQEKWVLGGITGLVPPSQAASGNGPGTPILPIPNTIIGTLRDESLLADDGRRKIVILISAGEIQVRSEFVPRFTKDLDAGKLDTAKVVDLLPDKLQRVVASARRSNSAIYVVDPRSTGLPRSSDRARLVDLTERTLADMTGGYAAIDPGAPEAGLARIKEDLDNYYVLGFVPADPRNTKPQALEVQVKGRELRVLHRNQYQINVAARRAAARANERDPLLGLVYSPMPVDDLPLKLWTTVVPTPAGPAQVVLWLASDQDTISEYGIWVINESTHKEATTPVGGTLSGNVPTPLPLVGPTVPPGRYQFRVAARTSGSPRGGSVFTTMTVPDLSKAPLAIAGVLIGTGEDYRNDFDPLPFTPSLDRTFHRTSSARLGATIVRRGLSASVVVTLSIWNAQGLAVLDEKREIAAADGLQPLEWPLSFRSLAAGSYALRLQASSGNHAASYELAFSVR